MQPGFKIPKIKTDNPELTESPVHVYEVIRIIDGIPLFLEDHIERLKNSAAIAGIKNLPSQESIEQRLFALIKDKGCEFGNVKVTFQITGDFEPLQYDLDFIPHFYPTEDKYSTGVKIGVMQAERPNPQAKIQHMEIRNKANLIMSEEKLYEVLLVDNQGNITEGSRSNIFFVKNNQVYTTPDEKVLNGITRRKILKLCMDNNIPVIKNNLPLLNIKHFEGAFLTGSSPKVLPVSSIGDIHYKPDLLVTKRIINLYNIEIKQYTKGKLQRL